MSQFNLLLSSRYTLRFGLILSLFLFLSCSDSTLPKYTDLNSLRILALLADPPEVAPLATVTVTPIISDINESTALTYTASACLDSGISLGAEPTCTGNATKVSLSSGTVSTLTTNQAFTGAANQISVTVPNALTILTQRSAPQQYNGVSYIFEYVLQNSKGEQVRSIKRLLVSDSAKTNKNINPVINDLLFDGTSATSLPLGSKVSTTLTYTGTPVESFQKMNSDGQLINETEELITTWFNTDGKIKYQRTLNTDANEYEGPSISPAGRPAFLIGITRDGRGGAAYTKKCFGTCL